MAKQTVNIHGKEYETVASRVKRFRDDHPDWAIIPEPHIDDQSNMIMFKTTIKNENDRILAVGHAEETRGSTQINRTSALENCETSSVGRALAILGYGGTELASADEVANAIGQQKADFNPASIPASKLSGVATAKQIGLIEAKRNGMQAGNPKAYEEFSAWYKTRFEGKPLKQLSKAEASELIDKLNGETIEEEIF